MWSPVVKDYHRRMTLKRQNWINVGRPRCGQAYTEYKSITRDFRRSLRNDDIRERERIDKLVELDKAGFWKVVNSRKTKSRQMCTQINVDGNTTCTHPDHILDDWRYYFENQGIRR